MSSSFSSMFNESKSEDDPDVYNVILFGGTHSRFSQFISGFSMWLNYSKYDDAICAEEIKPLLPLRYAFTDSNFKEHVVKVDGIHNEVEQDLKSTNRVWSTISIPTPFHNKNYPKNVFINFIQCPFEGSKGEENDKFTISQLKSHLSRYKYINAVIVLLDEKDSFVLTWLKLFCVDLEQNVLDNIIFVFTHNRSMRRKSVKKLQSLLEDINKDLISVKIPFNPGSNEFWLDNEMVEIFFANQKGYSIDEDDINRCVVGWESFVADSNSLLNYMANLTRFKITIEITTTELDNVIVKQVINFLHKISQLIQDNLTRIRSYEDVLSYIPKDIAQVIKFPFPKRIGVRIINLKKTINVCSCGDCTIDNMVQHSSLICYNTEQVCELNNEEESNEIEELCKTCGHHYQYHDVVHAKIEPYEIDSVNTEEVTVEKILDHLFAEKKKYKIERTAIAEAIAKLVLYLKTADNILSNDGCDNHLFNLMMREEKNCNKETTTYFETYKNFLECYRAQKLVLEENSTKSSNQENVISQCDIERIMEDLFKLEFTGEYIKKFYLGINNHAGSDTKEEDCIQEQFDAIRINKVDSMLTTPSIKNRKRNDMVTYNILLIGETGTGKSTFINSLGNYLEFPTFQDARNSKKIKVLIPTRIEVNGGYSIVGGNEENKLNSDQIGASDTQTCSVYNFVTEGINVTINFIDSPGIGDTRGIDQDDQNLDNIVETLGKFDYINAIVILLKPNDSRLSASFAYCLKGLLASLEKTAAQNIVFLFTNSRTVFYQPGETNALVKQVLANIKEKTDITIPFNSNNTFYLDNEAFKFLLESQAEGTLNEQKAKCCLESWEISSKISEKFLSYISQLPPHNIKESVSLVRARVACKNLIKPLSDITGFIEANIKRNERLSRDLLENQDNINELSKLMNTKRYKIRIVDLENTAGVCNHEKCKTLLEDSGMDYYEEICHEKCRVRGVKPREKEDDRMRYCSNMLYKGETYATCKTCTHSYKFHMLIHYKVERDEIKENKEVFFNQLQDTEAKQAALERKLGSLSQETKRYKFEQDTITKSLAKFAYYLQRSAIVPYNDSYEQYLRMQIENEKMNGGSQAAINISRYEEKLKQFQMEIEILEKECNDCKNEAPLNAEQVLDLIKTLYELPITGQYIEDMVSAIHKHSTTDIELTKVMIKQKGIMKSLHSAYSRSKNAIYNLFF